MNNATAFAANAAKSAKSALVKADGSPSVANMILQVVAGIAVSYLIYWASMQVMRTDKLVITKRLTTNTPTEVKITNGFVETAAFSNRVYNTMNADAPAYLALPRSVNRKGGAQFAYSFWLYIGSVDPDNVKNKVLFSRGSMRPYRYVRTPEGGEVNPRKATDLLVRCPLVRFGRNFKELIVEFNTADDPDVKVVLDNQPSVQDVAMRRNAASLSSNYWVMFTLVFEDNMPINDFESGIVMRYYLNDTLYQVSRVRGTLRQNNGSLNVLPLKSGEAPLQGVRMANFSYFNYAPSDEQIRARYLTGPSKEPHREESGGFATRTGVPLYLSAANQAEMTNL